MLSKLSFALGAFAAADLRHFSINNIHRLLARVLYRHLSLIYRSKLLIGSFISPWLTMGLSTTQEATSCLATRKQFMDPEGSLLHSQELLAFPCPESEQTSPHHPILTQQDSNWCYAPTYVLVFLAVSFPLAFLPITYTRSASPPFMLHAPPTSSSSTS
jgi:hypothetical protein